MRAFRTATGMTARVLAVMLLCLALAACLKEEKRARNDIEEARTALMQRDFISAEHAFERYLRRNPDGKSRWEAWNSLVDLALTVRHDRKAAIELLEAMRLEFGKEPGRSRLVVRQLGALYQLSRKYDQALTMWAIVAEDKAAPPEERAEAYRDQAEIYMRRLEFETAKEALNRCLAQNVTGTVRGQCLYDRAEAHMAEENLPEAIGNLRAVLAQEGVAAPLRSLSMFMLADALELQGNNKESLELFQRLLTTYPNPQVVEKRINALKKRAGGSKR